MNLNEDSSVDRKKRKKNRSTKGTLSKQKMLITP